MAGRTADKSKHIFQFYFVLVIGVCSSGGFVQSRMTQTVRLNGKIDPARAPIGEIHQHCKNLYRVQNKLETGESIIPHNLVLNCSYTENQSFPLDLTTDGYLRVADGNLTFYYPPSQFCITSSRKSAKVCQSQYAPTMWRKCCPEHHRLSGVTPKTCVNSSIPFRLNVSGDPHSFVVKANHRTLGSEMTPWSLPCPLGYRLKKLSTKGCSSRSMTRKALAALSSLFWNSDDETFPPCNHCSFQLYSNGTISYEEPTGVFIRKSEWKLVYPEEGHYCIDGVTSHSLSDCNNGQLDPGCGDDDDDGGDGQREQYGQMPAVLYICVQNESFEETNDASATAKTTLLAVIWSLTCPLLFGAALGNSLMIQRNVHGFVLTCYLLSMCLLNIISVLFILNVGRGDGEHRNEKDDLEFGGCRTIDFVVKFTYMSTLCWMTSINFGLWKTFRYTLPEPVGTRRFLMSVLFSLGFPLISVTVSYYMATLGSDHNCKSEYCVLFSYNTIPFYQVPISLMVLVNLAIFIKTTCTIASLRKEAADILQIQAQDHLKSFALFTKLFLLTGAIWLIRLVLFVLQIHGLYLSWYGVVLEVVFSIPEYVFPMTVLHHPEFIKWSWERAPQISRFIHTLNPFFKAVDSKKSVSIQS